jgi:hypothetical protein
MEVRCRRIWNCFAANGLQRRARGAPCRLVSPNLELRLLTQAFGSRRFWDRHACGTTPEPSRLPDPAFEKGVNK